MGRFLIKSVQSKNKRIILRRPAISNIIDGHINLDNFQFTPLPDVQSVVFEPVTNQVINGQLTNSQMDTVAGYQRIFPERAFPSDTINRKTVRVKAVVGEPNVTVYFKNFDVDDPTSDSTIDENGANGNDNREGRILGQPYPPAAAGVLSATSAVTNANGEAVVYFTVTKQPGDNFVVAASTSQTYLNGIQINGTGLKDSLNNALPTAQAKRTSLLTSWRRLHVEVDSMGAVTSNALTGYVLGKGINISSTPVWIEAYMSTSSPNWSGYLEEHRYKETLAANGTRLSYGGRMVVGGVNSLQVLDNKWSGTASPPKTLIQVSSPNQNVYLRPNQPFKLYDDDDFNDNSGDQKNGDEGEDVDALSDTFSRMLVSENVDQNAFAAAYILPEYNWAVTQGLNNSNVSFALNTTCSDPDCPEQRPVINANSGSQSMERDDFWIAYVLISYQAMEQVDADSEGFYAGVAPMRNNSVLPNQDNYNQNVGVSPGGIGAILFIEGIRDGALWISPSTFTYPRTKVATHEVGHQFGLAHNEALGSNGGIMNYTGTLYFASNHINMMRWRIKSPGE